MKAEAKNKSTKERLLEEKEAKGGGVDLGKPTSVDKSSELNKTIKDGDIALEETVYLATWKDLNKEKRKEHRKIET